MNWRLVSQAALGCAALILAAVPAQAASSRTFVSGKGVDSGNCGAVASPCRTFQVAHDNTLAGGSIEVLDSGAYGPVHIQKSISIINDGAGTAAVMGVAGQVSIRIDSVGASDSVLLRGLSLVGPSVEGITAINLGSLTVVNCIVRGSAGPGVNIVATSQPIRFLVSDSVLADNVVGINVSKAGTGAARGTIAHVTAVNNSEQGVALFGVNASIVDSVISNNGFRGLDVSGGASAFVRNVISAHNAGSGFVQGVSGSLLRLAHSAATGNSTGVDNFGSIGAESYGDNDLRGNSAAVAGILTSVANQ